MTVELAPITDTNLATVFDLEVRPDQQHFVAPNPWSLAQALVRGDAAWPRAIVADGRVVGFVMLEIDPAAGNGQHFYLWRLMVGADEQRKGFGRATLELVCDEVRRQGGEALFTAWVEGDGGPQPFYERFGFRATGEVDDGEIVARLEIT